MKNFSTWLIVAFAVLFLILRVAGILMTQTGNEFMIIPMNVNYEIILCFVAFVCILLIGKRKLIGAFVYLLAYGAYFGSDLFQKVMSLINGENLTMDNYSSMFFALIGIALPIAAVFDLLLDKNRKAHPVDKKTDWYYKNEKYDRQLDERADKNNYRTL